MIVVFALFSYVNGASILFYFGLATYSHRVAVWPLVERLAADGHDVTFLSGYLPKKPNKNVTEFSPKALVDFMSSSFGADSDLIAIRMAGQHVAIWDAIQEFGVTMCDILMNDQEYLGLLKNKKFDLVVMDMLNNDCAYGIIHYQKTKFVIYDTTHPMQWQYDMFGIPAETSYITDLAHGYKLPMSFPTRFINTLRPLMWYYGRVFNVYPKLEATINNGLGLTGDNALSIKTLEKNCSLVFTNTHFSVEHSRSLPQLFVPVAGLHIEKSKAELPKVIRAHEFENIGNLVTIPNVYQCLIQELKKFADESGPDGFIYISFGSGAQVSKTKPEFQRIFFNSLRKFKTHFIWKWEGDTIPEEMPPNVYTAKWMPQKDVLG